MRQNLARFAMVMLVAGALIGAAQAQSSYSCVNDAPNPYRLADGWAHTPRAWAQTNNVFVDGKDIGETPRELRVGEGFYRVRLEHPTLGKRETTLTVPAGRRATYNVNLAR